MNKTKLRYNKHTKIENRSVIKMSTQTDQSKLDLSDSSVSFDVESFSDESDDSKAYIIQQTPNVNI
jgi:hypothetical protein